LLHSDISKIISGCKRIVIEQEKKLYDRHFRLSNFSETYLCLLSMKNHIDLDFNSTEDGFRLRDVKNWLPDDLQNMSSRIIRRNSTMLLNSYYLRRDRLENRKAKNMIKKDQEGRNKNKFRHSYEDRGPKSFYTYSKSIYLLSLERLVLGITPRAIIYTILKNSGILERFLKICEYKKLLEIKRTEMNEMIKRVRTQTKTIGRIPESSFRTDKYMQEQDNLMGINRKKQLILIASEKANSLVHELDWRDRIYTRFFIAGGFIPSS